MKVITIQVGMMENNCYLVYDDNKNAICIDSGFDFLYILSEVKRNELKLKKIILTHGHFDHISAVENLRMKTGAEVLAYREEQYVIENDHFRKQFKYDSPSEVTYIDEGELVCGDLKFQVIHTPGHTQGGICLYIENALFSGDTIFRHYIGRCDLPTGDIEKTTDSIMNKLFTLPDDTIIYPGHNEATTIGQEKKDNEVYKWL